MTQDSKSVYNIDSTTKNILNNKTYKYKDLVSISNPINEFKDIAKIQDVFELKSDVANIFPVNLGKTINIEQQKDLAYGSCIYVSEGENDNGSFFLRQELIKARKTPILKPVDIEHNPDIIVGAIYDSNLLTQNGSVISDSDIIFNEENKKYEIFDKNGQEINDRLDIKTDFVIYKYMFPAVTAEISKYQYNDINKKYFVSMEVFYNEFGYVFDRDESSLVKIEDNLAGKELRNRYEEYINKVAPDGRHVSIAYLDYVFSAVGITERPANKRSYLLDLATKKQENNSRAIVDSVAKGMDTHTHTNLNEDKSSQEEKMLTKETVEAIEKAVNKAMASNPDLSADEARTGVLETRIETLINDNTELMGKLDTANDKVVVMSKEAESVSKDTAIKEEKHVSDIASKEGEVEKLSKELATANEELTTIRQEQLGSDRIMELETAGIKFGDRRDGVISRISKMSDEDYTAYKDDMTVMFASFTAKANEEVIVEPVAVEPVVVEPVVVEPVVGEPVAVEPVAVEPVVGEPVAVEPVAVEPVVGEPNLSTDSASAEVFNSATASKSNVDVDKDYNTIIEGVFKKITTRSQERKRGSNTIF